MRLVTKRSAKKRADRLFSLIVRIRDGQCRLCWSPFELECAHIFGRRHDGGRTDEANAVALCHEHHAYFTDHPERFEVWVRSWMGDDAYDELGVRVRQVTRVDWPAEARHLAQRLVALEEDAA